MSNVDVECRRRRRCRCRCRYQCRDVDVLGPVTIKSILISRRRQFGKKAARIREYRPRNVMMKSNARYKRAITTDRDYSK